jgi:predicted amidohydrolase YtcJ
VPTADLLLYGGRILTLSLNRPTAEAIAIADGKILAIGKERDLRALASPRTQKISCASRTVIPGFIDPHLHLFSWASRRCGVDVSAARSLAEIHALLANRLPHLPVGMWLRGYGYDEFFLQEKRHPTRFDLDEVSCHHPIILRHRTGHAAVLNSVALQQTGIDRSFTSPVGGMVERDPVTHEPTGVIYELEKFLRTVIPPLPEAEFIQAVQQVSQELLRRGVTSFHDASVGNTLEDFAVFERLRDSGTLQSRAMVMIGSNALPQLVEAGQAPFSGDEYVRLGSIKIMLHEGGGEVYPPIEEVNERVWQAHQQGFQVALHAVEEGSICTALEAISVALQRQPRGDHRHRIEHCALCPPPFIEKLVETGTAVVTQPEFLHFYGEKYRSEISRELHDWLYRGKSLLAAGVPVAGSSDCPIAPLSPLLGLQAAITRKTLEGSPLNPQERLPLNDALTLFTSAGAWLSFEESYKGKILPGMLADLVVLDGDLMKTPAEEIGKLGVKMTIVGGEIKFQV